MPDSHGSADSSLKESVNKPRLEPDLSHLLNPPPSCRSSPRDPRRPPPRSFPRTQSELRRLSKFTWWPPPSARLSPAHGHSPRQPLRVRLITARCAGRRAASGGLSPPSCPPRCGRHVRCQRGRPRMSVGARTAAGPTQLHPTVSSHIPLKGPLRYQITPGEAAQSPPPPCAQELFRILR